jgi:hypothetical protein
VRLSFDIFYNKKRSIPFVALSSVSIFVSQQVVGKMYYILCEIIDRMVEKIYKVA